jgi:hypothetical protein
VISYNIKMKYVGIYTFILLLLISCENKIGTSTLVEQSADQEELPTVSINNPGNINVLNQTSFSIGGFCSEPGSNVSIRIGALARNRNCAGSSWSINNLDLSLFADGAVLITANHSTATEASISITKNIISDSVLISLAPNINAINQSNYVVSGSCSSNGNTVSVDIAGVVRTPTCGSNTWSTGSVDVSGIIDGVIVISADHQAATQVTRVVSKATATPVISLLSVATTLADAANLNWDVASPGGFTINDYEVNYRIKGSSPWLTFNDGTSTNTFATVTGLVSSTVYEFRIRVRYNTSLFSPWSDTVEGETQPEDTIFGPNSAMNVGGSTSTRVAAFEDGTNITLNGAPLITLNKGQVHQFTSAQFDLIDSNKPIYTAGLRGASGNAGGSANIAWNPTQWAGKSFSFNATRTNPQVLEVYAIEDTTVEVKQGSTVLDTAIVTKGNGATLSWSVYGSYQVQATGSILAYHMSTGGGALHDPKPLVPNFTEIIGFPSSSMRLTTVVDNTNYVAIHSNSSTTSGSLNKSADIRINSQGTTSLFRGESLLISADKKISGASFADSNGLCAGAFISTNLMKRKYIIPTNSDYIAFASKNPGTIQVLNAGDTLVTTLTLVRSGANAGAPYRVRMANPLSGYRFLSTVPIGAWYQPNNYTAAGDEDETLLYGTND